MLRYTRDSADPLEPGRTVQLKRVRSTGPTLPRIPSVLIVEDDRVDAMILRELLERDGRFGTIHAVQDGEQAMRLWRVSGARAALIGGEFPPDVVFLDINMPRMDGFEFLHAFENLPWEDRSGTRFVILLGGLEPERDRARARHHSAVVGDLEKPFTSAAIRALADDLMAT